MGIFDGIILLGATLAAFQGYRLGFVARTASWLGLFVGVVLAARLLPSERWLAEDTPARSLLVLAGILLAAAFAGQLAGLLAASRIQPMTHEPRAERVDRASGAAAGVVGVIAAVWLLAPTIRAIPDWPALEARRSAIMGLVANGLPDAPGTFERLYALVEPDSDSRWAPDAGRPTEDLGPPPTAHDIAAATVDRASDATVKIRIDSCGRRQQGTGVVVRLPDGAGTAVVTNAHVVRDGTTITLEREDGSTWAHDGLLLHEPDRDLAVLSMPDVDVDVALELGEAPTGTIGAVLGYRGDGPLDVRPVALSKRLEARLERTGGATRRGDAPSDDDAVRDDAPVGDATHDGGNDAAGDATSGEADADTPLSRVWQMAAQIDAGDSGAPVIDEDGAVVGLVFAEATDRPDDVGFALRTPEVAAALERAVANAERGTVPTLGDGCT
ncbi:MAG: CvpA family protein [Actinomycetota bacterium]|nr:CvpA family protein [Actinomycetota bacterium]